MIIQCIICSDVLNPSDNIYFTQCGHLFHYKCLHTWITRSKTCPQCRNKVTEKTMFRVFITVTNPPTGEESAQLQIKLDNTMLELRQQTQQLRTAEELITELKTQMKKQEATIKHHESKIFSHEALVSALKQQLDNMRHENKEIKTLKEENEILKNNLLTLQGLQKIFNSTVDEVDQMLEGYTNVRTVATFATALKKALLESESKKTDIRNKLQATKSELDEERKKNAKVMTNHSLLEEAYNNLSTTYAALKAKVEALEKCKEGNSLHQMKIKQNESPVSSKIREASAENNDRDKSLTTMIKTIENADSPYLNLRQSFHLLAPQQNSRLKIAPKLKPSEFAMIKSAKKPCKDFCNSSESTSSIFHPKETTSFEFSGQNVQTKPNLDISYDGLGGHSKQDIFPTPTINSMRLKSCVPKLTSKHKLKRPAGVMDIGQMMKKARQD